MVFRAQVLYLYVSCRLLWLALCRSWRVFPGVGYVPFRIFPLVDLVLSFLFPLQSFCQGWILDSSRSCGVPPVIYCLYICFLKLAWNTKSSDCSVYPIGSSNTPTAGKFAVWLVVPLVALGYVIISDDATLAENPQRRWPRYTAVWHFHSPTVVTHSSFILFSSSRKMATTHVLLLFFLLIALLIEQTVWNGRRQSLASSPISLTNIWRSADTTRPGSSGSIIVVDAFSVALWSPIGTV